MPTDPSEDLDDLGVLLDALDALVGGVAALARRVFTREEQTGAGATVAHSVVRTAAERDDS